ncbi:phage baseplate assembly protein V [Cognatishimia sp. MH4019]|uniref:phage baseplate assembly protein V n=1 Tax=Cognatishimia sp. MH4019 TaxID=2854030 RepID=UPI001CD2A4DD|nr:phage baseplate assembly protein V [Cognatishimia sp. MH4019]
MADVSKIIARLQGMIAEDRRKLTNMVRSGVVTAVDPANQRVKVDVGDDGSPLITPWIRWTERAGARKTWNPPSVGELMTVLAQGGELDEKALAVHGGFTDQNAAPTADGDAFAFTLGSVTVTVIDDSSMIEVAGTSVEITNDKIEANVGGVTIEITDAGVAITSGEITHNGTDIGDTHKHSGIVPGNANTGTPV